MQIGSVEFTLMAKKEIKCKRGPVDFYLKEKAPVQISRYAIMYFFVDSCTLFIVVMPSEFIILRV